MSELAKALIAKEKHEKTGYLDLGRCGLTDLPNLLDLEWLQTLILSNEWWDWEKKAWLQSQNNANPNFINNSEPKDCLPKSLTKLIIGGDWNKKWTIRNLSFLEKLKNLDTLDLRNNCISDGHLLQNIKKLHILDLSSNDISEWAFLGKLNNLHILNISYNLCWEWGFLKRLKKLHTLYLRNNGISDVNFLSSNKKLHSLDVSDNNIYNLLFVNDLPLLQQLNLSGNRLNDLSGLSSFILEKELKIVWKEWYDIGNKEINVKANPLKTPTVEMVQGGNAAIVEYFAQKEITGSTTLLEAKLIILGDGFSGKTSLAKRMLGKELPTEADRTKGIEITINEHVFILSDPEDAEFKLHIWDFAGQDKYKPLHQFFYTEGAVYVFVANNCKSDTDYDDWFQAAQLFGAGSPLLVVLNEFEENVGYGSYNQEYWQERFPNLIKEHHLVNFLSQKNFRQLKKAIQYQAQCLSHTQGEYPKNWVAIRQELEKRRDENVISLKEYLKICKEKGLSERESALVLSRILHKIGVCLHYQNSELLKQYVILKNEWALDAMYKILEDQEVVEQKKGFFNWKDLNRIWANESYEDMMPQLLELMQKFKMAYPLQSIEEYVAPTLLPVEPPNGWEFLQSEALELRIEYNFLPKSLLTQFIVSRYTDIDEGRTLVWRNGVVLRWPDALAEVVKTKSRNKDAFVIHSQGINRKGLLTSILKTFRDLHDEYKGIQVTEVVPCPCLGCSTEQSGRYYFDFEYLKNCLELGGRRFVECGKYLKPVDLVRIFDNLFVFNNLTPSQPIVISSHLQHEQPLSETKTYAPLAFFSYSKNDEEHLKNFQKHLSLMERNGEIRLWDKLKIQPGEEHDEATRKNLSNANIIFLLLSPDFFSTEYLEMAEAIRRHKEGTARVIPILLRPCNWKNTPLVKLQVLPRNDKVVDTPVYSDRIWNEIIAEIQIIVQEWYVEKQT